MKDRTTMVRILARLERTKQGNFGDHKGISQDLSELRLDFGPGFRIYFSIQQHKLIILLMGGDKSTQDKDIEKAKQVLKDWIEDERDI